MLDDPARCYDPGYAAGATLKRANVRHTELMCEQGLMLRLESWAAHHFARASVSAAESPPAYREICREHFRRGFRDGYWGRAHVPAQRRRAALELVA